MKNNFVKNLVSFLLVTMTLLPWFTTPSLLGEEEKKRILVGSPVCQKPEILKQFLESLKRLDRESYTLDYFFIDDNKSQDSKKVLALFAPRDGEKVIIQTADEAQNNSYLCNESTHYWNESLVWKVAFFKDTIIQHAKDQNYDYLFFVDSDIVLHPKTVNQLIQAKKDIISNIFWTKWAPDLPDLPQVWLLDQYTLYHHDIGEQLSQEEIVKRQSAFLAQLRIPGVYEVGGLGACTLINHKAIHTGISFRRIPNITLWGEDRHFCVRAQALGLSLHVDTHYPAYHIYRESELPGVDQFIKSCQ